MSIKLSFWDMDHTIINNDCDVSWKRFLVQQGIAPAGDLRIADDFYDDYLNNQLDFNDFVDFQLREFCGKTPDEIQVLTQLHFAEIVRDTIYSEAREQISRQQEAGIQTILLTATNREIAAPLAHALDIETILATELEMIAGVFTGKISGPYCCAEGKAELLAAYAKQQNIALADCAYYGDSSADIAVLKTIGHPFAVNPGEVLRATAQTNAWPILHFSSQGQSCDK